MDSDSSGSLPSAPVRVGEIVAGKYVVEESLGVGGMGVVIAARDVVLERRVAIKFLLPRLAGSDISVQRFVREARSATRISSEHVVKLLEIDKLPNGTPFFVMEYLEGSDLRALLRERGALLPSLAVDYLLQALQAIAEGHLKQIVHRDLKPGNLFLTARADGTPLIKVLDFGIAKTLENDTAETNALTSSDDVRLGSPSYMPPEQLQNPRDVDTRSDIWALGATLYELLTGHPPFEGPGYLELVSRILSAEPPLLKTWPSPHELPSGLEAVVLKCLAKDRGQRYANAAELATALAPFGTNDARVSLTRVTGMWQASSISPVSRSIAAQPPESCTTTLPVAAETPSGKSARGAGSVSAGTSERPNSARRSWAVAAAAGSIVLGGIALQRQAAPEAPREPETAASRPIEPGASAAVVAVPIPTEASVAAAEPRTPPGVSAQDPPSRPPAPAPKAISRRNEPPPGRLSVATTTHAATPPAASTAPPAASSDVGTSTHGLGRSAEIERLIQERR